MQCTGMRMWVFIYCMILVFQHHCYKPNNSILTYFSLSFCNTSIQFDIFMCIFYLLKSKAHQFSALFFLVPVHILSQINE